jgi:hypothetical protein
MEQNFEVLDPPYERKVISLRKMEVKMMVNKKSILIALMTGISITAARAQAPITDSLVVTFPNEVQVGSQRLQAGEYTVKQINTASNPRLLEFSNDKGTSIQATATAIPALDNNNRNDSSVLIETYGGTQVLRQIWIKGKSYGYEFPVNTDQLNAARQEQIKLTAQFTPTPPAAPERTAQNVPPPQVTTPQATQQPTPSQQPPTVAPTPPSAETSAQPGRPAEQPSAPQNQTPPREEATTRQQPAVPSMPTTAIDWSLMLLAGIGLLGSGAFALTLKKIS